MFYDAVYRKCRSYVMENLRNIYSISKTQIYEAKMKQNVIALKFVFCFGLFIHLNQTRADKRVTQPALDIP